MRSDQQKFWDIIAILHLFGCANQIAQIDGNLKIQKLAFIYELKGQEKNFKAAHYRFFRHNLGPYSKDLANDVLALKKLGFITSTTNQLTGRGTFILEYLAPYLQSAETATQLFAILEGVCREYGRFSGPQLVNKVYGMTVPVIDYGNEKWKVKDIPSFTDILDPQKIAQLKEAQVFPEDVLADIRDELQIPSERLDPRNESVKREVFHRLQSIA
jgi:uncharacterized protein YwgA